MYVYVYVEASYHYVYLLVPSSDGNIVDLSGEIFKCFVIIHLLLCSKVE
jgi:hypothetical protein